MSKSDKFLTIFTSLFMISVFAFAIYMDVKMNAKEEVNSVKRSSFDIKAKDWNSNKTSAAKRYWLESIYLESVK